MKTKAAILSKGCRFGLHAEYGGYFMIPIISWMSRMPWR